jgi:long-chain fatty acid transport protein
MRRAPTLLCTLLLAAATARANPWDVTGFGARAIGMGGAFTALADDFSATYYNPAGLTARRKVHFGIGFQAALPALTIEQSRPDPARGAADPPTHAGITVGAVFPLGAKIDHRVAFGIGIYVPTKNLFRLDSVDPQTPQWYMHQALSDKLVIAPALAFRIADGFSLGVGLQVLADLAGRADFAVDLVNRRLTRRNLLVDLDPSASLTAGLLLGPFAGFRFGVSYRGSLALSYRLPATLDLESLGNLLLDIHGITAWTPNQVTFGLSYELPSKRLRFAFDLTFAQWSNAPDPSTHLDVDARGDVIDRLGLGQALDFTSPELPLGAVNTLTPRVGVEWSFAESWVLRGGYFFRPTPIPRQNGFTNYIDNDAHGFSAGIGWTHPDFLEIHRNPVTLELSVLSLYLPNRTARKTLRNDPVGDLESRGAIFAFAVSVRHDF